MIRPIQKIVAVVPTVNEEENIETSINLILKAFKKSNVKDYNILVVDSASTDKTREVVRKQITKNKNKVFLLKENKKSGLGSAYIKGMTYAFNKLNASHILQFDADYSHDATKIPTMVNLAKNNDLVIGTRYKKGGGIPKNWKFHRKLLSVAGNLFVRVCFLSTTITDWTGGFKIISKDIFDKALQLQAKDSQVLLKSYAFIKC